MHRDYFSLDAYNHSLGKFKVTNTSLSHYCKHIITIVSSSSSSAAAAAATTTTTTTVAAAETTTTTVAAAETTTTTTVAAAETRYKSLFHNICMLVFPFELDLSVWAQPS